MKTRGLKNRRRYGASAVAITAALAAAAPLAHANIITGTENWKIVSRLTGPNITGNVGIGGTDLGHMVNHNGKTYFLFGDTFNAEGANGSGGPDWRDNVMAWTTDRNPADGITFDGWLTRPDGSARQAIVPGTAPTTYIPTGGISVNNKIYAWYMHVSDWSTGWTLDHAGLASWQEGQSQFTTVPNYRFQSPTGGVYTTNEGRSGPGNFGMVAASQRSPLENAGDDNVYLWGTPGGRMGGVKLARVAPGNIENLSAYQFFNGTINGVPQWTNNEFDGDKLIDSNVGEMSVMYNPALEAWTLMSQNGTTGNFEIRSSKTPWGKWSDPQIVTYASQAPGLYAPFMNPLYTENNGKTLYFTMSLWDPYDVYLAKVDLDIDMQTRWTGTAGNWTTSTWDYGTPAAGDRVFVDNGGTVQLSSVATVRNFDAGSANGASGNIAVSSGAALTITDGGFRLGQVNGSNGGLNMTGGSINVTGGYNMFLVGDNGSGTATITGGTVTARTFGVALQPTSNGTFTVGGNAIINTTGDRFVLAMIRNTTTGQRPTATMTMTGGTINVNSGASGIPDAVIGFDGVASLNLSGGTFNVAGLFVSAVSGASGATPRAQATIVQTGGTINADRFVVSENGVSTYTLSNSGAINVAKRFSLGWRAGSEATFTQTGGAISGDKTSADASGIGFDIGEGGRGTYLIEGGTLTTSRRVVVGELAGAVGQMNVNGGAITVGTELTIGAAGSATATIRGGSVSAGTAVSVGSSGTLTYAGGSLTTPSLIVAGGGKVLFTPGGNKGLTLNTLTVDAAGGGAIDLADNRLVVNGGSAALSALNTLITTGYDNGDWRGAGITSSSAATNSFSAIGIAPAAQLASVPAIFGSVDASAILMRYTLKGDANLSGTVDFADLVALAQNYNGTGKLWHQGDSNYDGTVNFADLVSLAQNYHKLVSPGATQLNSLSPSFAADWGLAQSLVPEPAMVLSAGLLGSALLRRRRFR